MIGLLATSTAHVPQILLMGQTQFRDRMAAHCRCDLGGSVHRGMLKAFPNLLAKSYRI